jgi:hypothetical protein
MPERGVMSGPVSELTWARNISIKLEIMAFYLNNDKPVKTSAGGYSN